MTADFVLGRHPNGERRLVQFDPQIDYEVPEFEFSISAFQTGENIAAILRQYAEVDRINRIKFAGVSWVDLYDLRVRFDVTVLLYGAHDVVAWRAAINHALPLPRLTRRVLRCLEPLTIPLRPIVAGTARVILADIKQGLRAEILAKAAHRACVMRSNANAILAFLELPIPIDMVEPLSDTADMIARRAQAASDVLFQTAGEFPHES